MQSEGIAASPTGLPPALRRVVSTSAIVFFAVLPLLGLASEIVTGTLSPWLGLFPTWWHVAAVVAAITLNLWLHVVRGRAAKWLPARATAMAFVAGMALLYAIAEMPALPLMVFAVLFFGLGLLAAAPYFVCLGFLRLVPDLVARWRDSERGALTLLACLAVGLLPAVGLGLYSQTAVTAHEATALGQLRHAMAAPAPAAVIEERAVAVRAGDRAVQRGLCTFGDEDRDDDDWFFALSRGSKEPFAHLASGRDFWFHRKLAAHRLRLATEGARLAFHRAHGEGWDDAQPPRAQDGWDGGASIEWQASRFTITAEPAAAIARVDWEIEVDAAARWPVEARFDVRLPSGAVVSSLSSWIADEERPAAFAGAGDVQAAYDQVVRKQRDPVLVRERAPGSVQMLLFPLSKELPPMRVRVGFTVPLRWLGERATLCLPQVVGHNCRGGEVDEHLVRFDGEALPRPPHAVGRELGEPIDVPRIVGTVHTRDADGILVQQLTARPRVATPPAFVVVIEASASMTRAVLRTDEMLAAFPRGVPCVLFVAHGDAFVQHDGGSGAAELGAFVREQPCTGGVDATGALRAAIAAAKQRGVARVYWLHGTAATRHFAAELPRDADVEIVAFAVRTGRHAGVEEAAKRGTLVEVPRHGDSAEAMVSALAEFVAFAPPGGDHEVGDHARVFDRALVPPTGSVEVSDQIARLWAARRARGAVREGDAVAGAQLAARFRVATAGVGAVVLETKADYDRHGLDPGAEIGREPMGPVGSGPVPEPSTLVLLGGGLLALAWRQRQRQRSRRAAAATDQ